MCGGTRGTNQSLSTIFSFLEQGQKCFISIVITSKVDIPDSNEAYCWILDSFNWESFLAVALTRSFGEVPALTTAMSSWLKTALTLAARPIVLSSFAISAFRQNTVIPGLICRISASTPFRSARVLELNAIADAPARAYAFAIEAPIPFPEPIITTTNGFGSDTLARSVSI